MIKISKIEVQKKHDNRVSVFVNDEYYGGMLLDTAVKYGIKKDLEIEETELQFIMQESEKHSALNKATNYINTAFKTTRQLREYLKKKGYEKPTIDYVIEKLTEYDFLNDRKYAEIYIQTYKTNYGVNMLKTKLFEKGIPKTIVEELLNEYECDEAQIDKLLQKKIGNKTLDNDLLTKCMRFLSGRGFKYEEINSAIKRYKENHGVDIDESWD